MRSYIVLLLLTSSFHLVSQEKLVFLTGQDSTLIIDGKTLQMQSKNGSLFVGRFAGFSEVNQIGNTSIGNSAGYQNKLGFNNTKLGYLAGMNNVSGSENVYLGAFIADNATGSSNVAIGAKAFSLNEKGKNTVVGFEAAADSRLASEFVSLGYQAGYGTEGTAGTFVGFQAGFSNDDGDNLTAIGHSSGYSNTSGLNNTFLGVNSGYKNTTAGGNTFLGSYSGWENTGPENTFIGVSTGANNTASNNVMIGYTAGLFSQTGKNNVFIGHNSGRNNDAGSDNVFLGFESGLDNGNGLQNVAIGSGALKNAIGQGGQANPDYSVAVGFEAGSENYGQSNTFLGYSAGSNSSGGDFNTYVGRNSGSISKGNRNTFVGYFSGQGNQLGNQNTYLGYNAGRNEANRSGNVHIGHNVEGRGSSNELIIDNSNTTEQLIYGQFDNDFISLNGIVRVTETANQAFLTEDGGLYLHHDRERRLSIISSLDYQVPQNSQGDLFLDAPTSVGLHVANQPNYYFKLPTNIRTGDAIARSWDTYSDRRIKSNVKELDYGLATLSKLNPVSYIQHSRDYEKVSVQRSSEGIRSIGLIAQDVYKVIPEAVKKPKNEENELWTMNYEKLIPVLIKSIQELQEQVELLEGRLAAAERKAK